MGNKFVKAVRRIFLHNFTLKLVSILFAIVLWSYVASSMNTMRLKAFDGISISYLNSTVLEANGLTLVEDLGELQQVASVKVDVLRSQYDGLSASDVSLAVDLSNIQAAGTFELPIIMDSRLGEGKSVTPSKVTVHIDKLVTAIVPVVVDITEKQNATYWQGEVVPEPATIEVIGPESIISKVAQAKVEVSLAGRTATFNEHVTYLLCDAQGSPITSSRLTVNPDSIALNIPILPLQRITLDGMDAITGVDGLPDGYEIKSVEIYPQEVRIAGDVKNMDLPVAFAERIDIAGKIGDVTGTVRIQTQDDIKLLDVSEVNVTVRIGEVTNEVTLSDVPVEIRNVPANLSMNATITMAEVTLMLPLSQVEAFDREDLVLYIDLMGKKKGSYTLTVDYELPASVTPEKITITPSAIDVTLQ